LTSPRNSSMTAWPRGWSIRNSAPTRPESGARFA
jgi:hypothetical protein